MQSDHVAIVMDGNGRWAADRGLPRSAGHRAGVRSIRAVVRRCRELEIRFLTLYAFSTENWNRPKTEVAALMSLLKLFLKTERPTLIENHIALRAIGDLRRLSPAVHSLLLETEALTSHSPAMRLTLAVSYGGRDEITRAVRQLATKVRSEGLDPSLIDEQTIEGLLDTGDAPPPDLIIRSGGEQRLSGFLLWQSAYAELYFSPVMWPDFGCHELDRALAWYAGRQRRFGHVLSPNTTLVSL